MIFSLPERRGAGQTQSVGALTEAVVSALLDRAMPTRSRALLLIGLAAILLSAAPAALHAASDVTLRVEVIDPAAYLQNGQHGAEFADRTYEAVEGGQTLALLDPATGTVYTPLAAEPGEDPNELVYDYANQLITVTGRVYEKGGLKGLVVLSVEGPTPATAEADAAAAASGAAE